MRERERERVESFELTPEMVKLLRASIVSDRLSDREFGAAEIDPNRPYGNSDVLADIARILGLPVSESGGVVGEVWTRAHLLHEQTPRALQVVLSSGSFQPGIYLRTTPSGSTWVLETPTPDSRESV